MSGADTASPAGAREHARSMAGTIVEAMPTVPAGRSTDPPPGVAAADMLWEETIAAGGYASKRLGRGALIRVIDLHGDACLSMLAFNAEQPVERLNVADTIKVQWNAYLGTHRLLLTDMGRVLFSILEDGAGTHDAFCGASNQESNARHYGDGFNHGAHPNARDRFALALAKWGLGRKDVHAALNWFKGVTIAEDGGIHPEIGPFPPGRSLTLRAEMELIVVFANCPHVLDKRPAYTVTPARVSAWRGALTSEADPVRLATPEGLRAFLNTEDYYRR